MLYVKPGRLLQMRNVKLVQLTTVHVQDTAYARNAKYVHELYSIF